MKINTVKEEMIVMVAGAILIGLYLLHIYYGY